MRFRPGDLIVDRNTHLGRPVNVRAARVVSDDDRGTLLWIAQGTPMFVERTVDGRGMREMTFAQWQQHEYEMVPFSWNGPGILKFFRPGEHHSVWWFWEHSGDFQGWYINLEEPGLRWDDGHLAGVDYLDQDLDVWVEPDRSWQWKDEHELAERLAHPEHYWVPDPDAVWAEGRRVIAQVEAGLFPFDGTWCDFRPDPGWSVPTELPRGWDRPPAHPTR